MALRWLYADTTEERAAVQAVRTAMGAFWAAFAERAGWLPGALDALRSDEIASWMNAILRPVSTQIGWEFGPGAAGGERRLAFSAEGAPSLRLVVRELIGRAPPIEGWEIYPERIAVSLPEALRLVSARTGHDVPEEARAVLSPKQDGLVDVILQVPDAPDDDSLWGPALLLLESLLGERTTREWGGALEVTAPPTRFARWFQEARTGIALADLPAAFGAHREKFTRDRRPWSERLAGADGHLVKASPPVAADYPAHADIIAAQAPHVGLWMALHRGRFAPARFTSTGEVFAYLKIDAEHVPTSGRVAWRDPFARAVSDVLTAQGLGAVIGEASGHRYAYVDLALTDVGRAWPLITDVLQARDVPRRAWLLFFEPELAEEWLPVWPDAGPPPG